MSDLSTFTKAELMEKLAEANAIIEEQKTEIEEKQERLAELTAAGEGWLIETPTPLYNGVTMGVQFVKGQAFLRKQRYVEQMDTPPLKDSYFEKMKTKPEEIKAIREREQMTTAERAVIQLEQDFGYKVTYFDGTKSADEELEKLIDERAKEYAQAYELMEAQKKAEDSVLPHFMGA